MAFMAWFRTGSAPDCSAAGTDSLWLICGCHNDNESSNVIGRCGQTRFSVVADLGDVALRGFSVGQGLRRDWKAAEEEQTQATYSHMLGNGRPFGSQDRVTSRVSWVVQLRYAEIVRMSNTQSFRCSPEWCVGAEAHISLEPWWVDSDAIIDWWSQQIAIVQVALNCIAGHPDWARTEEQMKECVRLSCLDSNCQWNTRITRRFGCPATVGFAVPASTLITQPF